MKESLQQVTEQRQQQTLSPLQVQLARTLEMTGPEFEEEVRRALDENPALEEDSSASDVLPKSDDGDSPGEFTETPEQMMLADYRNDEEIPHYRLNVSNRSADDEVWDPASTQTSATTLRDFLEQQLAIADTDESLRPLAAYVMGNIDSNGYLTRTADEMVDDIAFAGGPVIPRDSMLKAVALVQQLEPAGVGAYDLRHTLLLQLNRLDRSDAAVADAHAIIADYFDLFAARHFDRLKSSLSLSDNRLREALALIRTLNPKPGAQFEAEPGEDRLSRIVPDFEVEVDGPRVSVTMTGNMPQLRVAESFLIDDDSSLKKRGASSDAMMFVRRKRDEAADFIRAAATRRETLLRVMKAIARIQRDFFMSGGDPYRLHPMILKDVAAITGDDLSVISRATAGKYVQTPSGIYPLKFFFNEKPKENIDASTRQLLDALRAEIEAEDPHDPLSDQALAERLAARGYDIARRTVTKYREKLGLPVARLRRQI